MKTFLSYIPDSIEKSKHLTYEKKLHLEKILYKNMNDLVSYYSKYDLKINRSSSLGVLQTLKEFATTEWIFNPNYSKPKSCVGSDSINLCWILPNDFIDLTSSKMISGMPYCWGGKMIFQEFLDKIDKNYAPGDICGKNKCRELCSCVEEKYLCSDGKVAGIDCSGLVVKAFKLDEKSIKSDAYLGTYDLSKTPKFNCISNSYLDLKRGDILLKPGFHVAICVDINLKSNLCRVAHSSDGTNFFKHGIKDDGCLESGVRYDNSSIDELIYKLQNGYTIYRFAMNHATYAKYEFELNKLLMAELSN